MKRLKVVVSSIALMFSMFLFVFGVYSLSTPTLNITGTVSFYPAGTSTNLLIRGRVNGQASDEKASTQQAEADFPVADTVNYAQSVKVPATANSASQTYLEFTTPVTDYETNQNGVAPWNMGSLYFFEDKQGIHNIVIEIELTNYSDYAIQATVATFSITDSNVKLSSPSETTVVLRDKGETKVLQFVLTAKSSRSKLDVAELDLDIQVDKYEDPESSAIGWTARQDNTLGGLVLTNYNGPETDIIIPSELKISELVNADEFATAQANSNGEGLNLNQYDTEQAITVVGVEGNVSAPMPLFTNFPAITSVYIPKTIKYIGPVTFGLIACTNPTDVLTNKVQPTFTQTGYKVTFEKDSQLQTLGPVAFAFSGLTSINLPYGITSFDSGYMLNSTIGTFESCNILESFVIPDSVITIGDGALEACTSLKSVVIGKNVKTIDNQAFYGCTSLQSITIPDSVTSINQSAFAWCESLNSIVIGSGVTSINDNVFSPCEDLQNVYYHGTPVEKQSKLTISTTGNDAFTNAQWWYYNEDTTTTIAGNYWYYNLQGKVVTFTVSSVWTARLDNQLGGLVITNYSGTKSNVVIPSNLKINQLNNAWDFDVATFDTEYQVVGVEGNTEKETPFIENYTNVTSVYIPNTIKQIGMFGLAFLGLQNMDEMVESNGTATPVFSDIEITFEPNSNLETIDIAAFAFSGIEKAYIPEKVTTIEQLAFAYNLRLEQIDFNATAVEDFEIDSSVFGNAGLSGSGITVNIAQNVTKIPSAFLLSDPSSFQLPNVKAVNFAKNSLCEYIGPAAFALLGCENPLEVLASMDSSTLVPPVLHEVEFNFEGNNSLTEIGMFAFAASGIKQIEIPQTVTTIGDMAFYYDTLLETIDYKATNVADFTEESEVFGGAGINGDGIAINISNNVERIPASFCFVLPDKSAIPNVTSIIFESRSKCQSIGDYAFAFLGCQNTLEVLMTMESDNPVQPIYNRVTLDFGSNSALKEIGMYSFGGIGVDELTIPENVKVIGPSAFLYLADLEKIYFNATSMDEWFDLANSNEENFKEIFSGVGAFSDGVQVIVGENVEKIPGGLFCSMQFPANIKSVKISDSVKEIGDFAFAVCQALETIDLGNGVEKIGMAAFGLTSVKQLTIPQSVKTLAPAAFAQMLLLETVYYNATAVDDLAIEEEMLPFGPFDGCGISGEGLTVIVGDNVTKIPNELFVSDSEQNSESQPPKIVTVIIGNSVVSIGKDAFVNCESILNVYYHGTAQQKNNTLSTIKSGNECLTNATWWYYNEDTTTTIPGRYWYYDNQGDIQTFSVDTNWDGRYDAKLGGVVLTNYSGTANDLVIPSTITPIELMSAWSFGQENFETDYTVVGVEGNVSALKPFITNFPVITSIYIPNTIKYIGPGAFALTACTNPVEVIESFANPTYTQTGYTVTFEENSQLTQLGGGAFGMSGITSINLPDTIEALDSFELNSVNIGTFYACFMLSSITIPESVISIGENCFANCISLTEITIPENVKQIDTDAFSGTVSLETIYFNAFSANNTFELEDIKEVEDILNLTCAFIRAGAETDGITVYFGNSVERVPGGLFFNFFRNDGPNIKTAIFGNSVKSIGFGAFYGTPLQSISLPDGLIEIEADSFGMTDLTSVTVPAGVKIISGEDPFGTLSGLTTIYYNATNLNDLERGLFGYDHDREFSTAISLIIGDNVTRIPAKFLYQNNSSFFTPKVTTIVLGNSVQSIGNSAFGSATYIEKVYYHGTIQQRNSTLTSIEAGNDYLTNAQWWYFNENTEETLAGNYWYYDNEGNIVEFTVVADWTARMDTSLGGLVLTNYNGSVSDLVIPSSLKIKELNNALEFSSAIYDTEYMVVGVEGDVENLKPFITNFPIITSIYIPNTIKYIGPGAFALTACTNPVEVLEDFVNPTYTQTGYTVTFEANSRLTQLGGGAFGMSGLTSINLPDTIATLDSFQLNTVNIGTFYACFMLSSITIPESITSIGENCFANCLSLTEIAIPEDVKSIGSYAFSGTLALETINFNAIYVRDFLRYDIISGSTEPVFLSEGVFDRAGTAGNGITITFGIKVTKVPAGLFYPSQLSPSNCPKVTAINFGNQIKEIGMGAFVLCTGVTSLSFPDSLEIIRDMAFAGTSENNLVISNGVKTIGKDAFWAMPMQTLTIGENVKSIVKNAFYDTTKLQKIYFNATNMSDIADGEEPFGYEMMPDNGGHNYGLGIVVGDNVTRVPARIFNAIRGMKYVVIGNSVTTIGDNAFSDHITSYYNEPLNVYYHGTLAHRNSTLKTIGEGTWSTSAQWWYYNENTSTRELGNFWYYDANGDIVTFTVTEAWIAKLNNTGDGLILTSCITSDTDLTIPSSFKVSDLTNASDFEASLQDQTLNIVGLEGESSSLPVFANTLTNINLPSTITSIGQYSFYGCSNLSQIVISGNVTTIGNSAFGNCSSLANVYYHGTEEHKAETLTIANSGNDPLTNAKWWYYNEDTTTEVPGNYWYYDQSGNIVTFTVTSVPYTAKLNDTSDGLIITKYNGSKTDVTIPSSFKVSELANASDFAEEYQTQTLNVVGLEGTGSSNPVFASTLTNITFPSTITSIGQYSFYNCSNLTNFTLPANLTIIGQYAFYGNSTITTLTIPENVTSIEDYAFCETTSLETINFNAINCSDLASMNNVFANSGKLGNGISVNFGDNAIRVPAYLFKPYIVPDQAIIISVNLNRVQEIGIGAFSWSAITTLTIPESVTSIGAGAFRNTTELETINFNATNCVDLDQMNSVFSDSGQNGSGITLTFADEVTRVPAYMFSPGFEDSSPKITVLNLNKVQTIGYGAFGYLASLTTLTIPASVTTIENNAFNNTTALAEINFNAVNCADLSECNYVFYESGHSTSGISVNIGDGVLNIPANLFASHNAILESNPKITFINLNEVQTIGEKAFRGCYTLTSVTIPETVTSIASKAFDLCYRMIEVTNLSSHITGLRLGGTNNGYLTNNAKHIRTSISDPSYLSTVGEYTWYQDDTKQEYYLVNYTGSETELTLPNTTPNGNNYATRATFVYNKNVTQITIPDTVTQIDDYTFKYCSNLSTVDIGDNITRIGEDSFYNCSKLSSINLPESLLRIESWAFSSCSNLTSITIPDSVTYIGGYSFVYCNKIEYVVLGSSVKKIEGSAFNSCSLLANVYYHDTEEHKTATLTSIASNNDPLINAQWWYYNEDTACEVPGDYWYYDGDGNIVTFTVTSVPYTAKLNDTSDGLIITKYNGSKTDVTIPSSIKISTLANASDFAEEYQTQTLNVVGLEGAGSSNPVFASTLTNITLPSTITSIGQYSFYNCSNLTNFTLPANLTTIGTYAFFNNSTITSLTIPESVTSIGNYAFYNAKGIEIINFNAVNCVVPEGNHSVFSYVGHDTQGITVNLGDSVTKVPSYLFNSAGIPDGAIKIITVNFNNVQEIGKHAFRWCTALTTLNLNNVQEIGDYAFASCLSLTTLTIPETVTSIANSAFNSCYRLIEITNLSSHLTSLTLGGTNYGYLAYYSKRIKTLESDPSYLSTVGDYTWYQDDTKQEYYLVNYTGSETTLTLPNTTPNGNNYATRATFVGNENITQITIPETVTQIDDYTFSVCSNLESINIGKNVSRIGVNSLYMCSKLAEIELPQNLQIIDKQAFLSSVFEKIVIPDNVKTLNERVFQSSGLKSAVIGDGVQALKTRLFISCSNLEYIVIGSGVKEIAYDAFQNCSLLTNVYYHGTEEHKTATLTIDNSSNYNDYLINAQWWYYNEDTACEVPGDYWYYDGDGNIVTFTVTNVPYTAKLNDTSDGLIITKYNGSKTDVTIPSSFKVSELANASDFAEEYQTQTLNVVGLEGTNTSNPVFKNTLTNVAIHDGVTVIGDYAFAYCKDLTVLIIPDSVTTIGKYAFFSCSNLKTLTIGKGVTTIGDHAFSHTTALETINFNAINCEGYTTNKYVFYYAGVSAESLTINFGDDVLNIPAYMFYEAKPTDLNLNKVQTIGDSAFRYGSRITTLTIPESVTSIGSYVFYNSTALETINFNAINCADMKSTSSNHTFAASGINGVVVNFGNNATRVPGSIFTSLPYITSVNLNNVQEIGENAFDGCNNLTTLTIPETVTTMGYSAFRSTTALTQINFNAINFGDLNGSNPPFNNAGSSDGLTINFGDNVTRVPSYLFYGSNVSLLNLNKVQSIGKEAFYDCAKLSTVTFPQSLTSIENNVFQNCSNLISVSLSENMKSIGSSAFSGCYRLIEVTNLSSYITNLSIGSTSNGGVTQYAKHIRTSESDPSYLSTVGDYIWYQDDTNQEYYLINYLGNETVLTLPDTTPTNKNYNLRATFVDTKAFSQSTLQEITIPDTVTQIDDYTFNNCVMLEIVNLPNTLTKIGKAVFLKCEKIQTLQLPNTLLSIGSYAISQTGIKSIVVPDSVTTIEEFAFSYCYKLEYIVLGSNVQTIAKSAFVYCSALTNVYYNGTQEEKESKLTIDNTDSKNDLLLNATWWYYNEDTNTTTEGHYWYYDNGQMKLFTVGPVWEAKLNASSDGLIITRCLDGRENITIPSSIQISSLVNASEFSDELQNQTFDIVGIETSTNTSAFLYTLKSISLPNTITYIGQYAFYNRYNLINCTLSENLVSIAQYAFANCSSLQEIIIPNKVTTIETYAFANCSELTDVTIGEGVTTIGDYAFKSTTALNQLNFNAVNCTDFDYDNRLFDNSGTSGEGISVIFGSNVIKVPAYLFAQRGSGYVLPKVKAIIFGSSVETIGTYSFEYCKDITTLIIPDNVTTIEEGAFTGCSGLITVKIGEGLTIINRIFNTCSNLTTVIFGSKVTTVKSSAFYLCNKLTNMYYNGTQAQKSSTLTSISSGNTSLTNATWYYYSETGTETTSGKYWYYDENDEIVTFTVA